MKQHESYKETVVLTNVGDYLKDGNYYTVHAMMKAPLIFRATNPQSFPRRQGESVQASQKEFETANITGDKIPYGTIQVTTPMTAESGDTIPFLGRDQILPVGLTVMDLNEGLSRALLFYVHVCALKTIMVERECTNIEIESVNNLLMYDGIPKLYIQNRAEDYDFEWRENTILHKYMLTESWNPKKLIEKYIGVDNPVNITFVSNLIKQYECAYNWLAPSDTNASNVYDYLMKYLKASELQISILKDESAIINQSNVINNTQVPHDLSSKLYNRIVANISIKLDKSGYNRLKMYTFDKVYAKYYSAVSKLDSNGTHTLKIMYESDGIFNLTGTTAFTRCVEGAPTDSIGEVESYIKLITVKMDTLADCHLGKFNNIDNIIIKELSAIYYPIIISINTHYQKSSKTSGLRILGLLKLFSDMMRVGDKDIDWEGSNWKSKLIESVMKDDLDDLIKTVQNILKTNKKNFQDSIQNTVAWDKKNREIISKFRKLKHSLLMGEDNPLDKYLIPGNSIEHIDSQNTKHKNIDSLFNQYLYQIGSNKSISDSPYPKKIKAYGDAQTCIELRAITTGYDNFNIEDNSKTKTFVKVLNNHFTDKIEDFPNFLNDEIDKKNDNVFYKYETEFYDIIIENIKDII